MKFFSIDSPLYRFMQRLTDVIVLNILWLVFSLPIVTIGCSTAAAFSVTMKFLDESEGHIWSDFISAFKANWKQGLPLGLISIVAAAAVYLDFKIAGAVENSLPFLIVGFLTAFFLSFSLLYVFPLIVRYENSITNCLKNSFRLAMKHVGRTFLLIIILAFELAVIFWNTVTLFIGLLIGPACIIYTISGTAMHIFKETEKDPSSVSNPEKLHEHDGQ